MACDCIDVMGKKMAEHNTKLGLTFCFPRDGSPSFSTVTIVCEKINTRNRTRVSAMPTFCPFCGVRYVPEPSSGEA